MVVSIEDFPNIKMYDSDFRPALVEMYNNVTKINSWHLLNDRKTIDMLTFMDTQGHSGRTFSVALMCMKKIHEMGLEKFKQEYGPHHFT